MFYAHRVLVISALIFVGIAAGCRAQETSSVGSICNLQETAPGSHVKVRISGIYGPGLDHSVLSDAECPTAYTWVELALHSQQNKEKLRKLLDYSRQARVVVEGDFYGPPLPDAKLPDAIKKQYHPGWGHLGAFPTKIVVHRIDSVTAISSPPQ